MGNRWVALAIISLSFIQFTLNWFCIVPASAWIMGDMGLVFRQFGVSVEVLFVGYGLAHIPGGWLARRYGIRHAMLLGIAVESVGAAVSAWAPSFNLLLVGRLLCGVGGSIYLGSAIGLTTAWFRERELATANAIVTGVASTVGAAVGLFTWGHLIAGVGWRDALLVGAGIGVATLVFVAVWFPVPADGGIPTAVGLMLTIVAIGGGVAPRLHVLTATSYGFAAAWGLEGVVCVAFALVALLAPHARPRSVVTGRV